MYLFCVCFFFLVCFLFLFSSSFFVLVHLVLIDYSHFLILLYVCSLVFFNFLLIFLCVCSVVIAAVCLLLFLLFVLGFVCLLVFFSFLSFFSGHTVQLAGSWFLGQWLGLSLQSGAPSPGHWTAREFLAPGNITQHAHSWRSPCQHQDPTPHNCLQAPAQDTSCQTTSKTGTQPQPSADRLPKVVLSSQTLQNTPLDTALPFRGKRLSSTHQSAGTSPSHQEAYTSPWSNLTHQGADNRSKRNYDPTACRRRP